MPLSRSHIRRAAEAYLARHPHERGSLAGLLSLLEGDDHPADRSTLPGHVTYSAAAIDRKQRCCTSVAGARGCYSTRSVVGAVQRSIEMLQRLCDGRILTVRHQATSWASPWMLRAGRP
ncbi:hypothetical protein ACWC6I_42445 [Streptomyces sp. NPDC001414]